MRKKEAELEAVEKGLKTVTSEITGETPYINEGEKAVLSEQAERDEAKSKEISTKKMEAVVETVQNTFKLADGNYVVGSFSDKGNKSQVSLSNEDFELTIVIKDNEKFGII